VIIVMMVATPWPLGKRPEPASLAMPMLVAFLGGRGDKKAAHAHPTAPPTGGLATRVPSILLTYPTRPTLFFLRPASMSTTVILQRSLRSSTPLVCKLEKKCSQLDVNFQYLPMKLFIEKTLFNY
jgi:hypothetical protein